MTGKLDCGITDCPICAKNQKELDADLAMIRNTRPGGLSLYGPEILFVIIFILLIKFCG